MAAKASRDALFDVPDSTDWHGTSLPGFAEVEAPMRCQVCKEFMMTPMITSCGHTFCSVCIRRCLANDGLCPACRTPDQELKLRPNKSMEEVVESFQKARKSALEVGRARSNLSVPRSPKRKIADAGFEDDGQGRRTKSTRSSNRIASQITPQRVIEVADVELSDGDYEPDDGLIACPICSTRMKMEHINTHLDTCTDVRQSIKSKNVTSSISQSPSNITSYRLQRPVFEPKPLPTLNYSLINDMNLRKKFKELGISSAGSRPLLERRHKEWLTVWNANCDASKPRSKTELLRELDIWERTQGGQGTSRSHNLNSGCQVASKDFDGVAWASKHEPAFQNLIEEARRKRRPQSDVTAVSASESIKMVNTGSDDSFIDGNKTCEGDPHSPTSLGYVQIDARSHEQPDDMKRANEGNVGDGRWANETNEIPPSSRMAT